MVLARSEVQLVGLPLKRTPAGAAVLFISGRVTGTEPQVQLLLEDVDSFKVLFFRCRRGLAGQLESAKIPKGGEVHLAATDYRRH